MGSLVAVPLGLGAAAASATEESPHAAVETVQTAAPEVPEGTAPEPTPTATTAAEDLETEDVEVEEPAEPADEILAEGEEQAEDTESGESEGAKETEETETHAGAGAVASTEPVVTETAEADASDPATAADSETDGVTDGIAPGETRQIPIDVVNTTSIRAVVAAPTGVDVRLATETGSIATAWQGLSSTSKSVSMGFLEPTTGRFVLEIRNNTDAPISATHELASNRAGEVRLDPRVSLTLDRLQIRVMIDDQSGPVSGATLSVRITGSNGIYFTVGIPETSTGIYEFETSVMRSGDFTLHFSTTIDSVEYTAVAAGRVVGTDSTGPEVTIATDPATPNPAGWFTGGVDAVITAEDPQGVFVVWYEVGDGTRHTSTDASFSIPFTEDGEHVVRAWAWDSLLNISETVTTTVSVDASPAEITTDGALAGGSVTVGETATAEFACTDPHSGIVDCVLELEDGTRLLPGDALPTETAGTINYVILAQNGAVLDSELEGSLLVAVDSTPPAIAVTTVPAASNARGWFARDVAVTLTASDAGSGVEWVEYHLGDEEWMRVDGNTVDIPITTDGRTTITYRASDGAGNVTGDRTRFISLDRIAPTIEITGVDGVEVELGELLVMQYECSDAISGVFSCVSATPSGEQLPTDTAGSFEVRVNAIDNAGNVMTEVATYTVIGPELMATAVPTVGSNIHGWWNDDIVVDLAVVTGDRVHWELEGSQTGAGSAAGSARVTITAEGNTRLNYWASDESGASEPVALDVRIDRTAPEIIYLIGPHETLAATPSDGSMDGAAEVAPVGLSFDLDEQVEFDFGCADDLSLVEACESDITGAYLPTDEVGTVTLVFRAVDHAGNETVESLVYEVVDPTAGPGEEPGGQPGPGGSPHGGTSGLARTGLEVAPIALGVLALAGLGALLMVAARRRTT